MIFAKLSNSMTTGYEYGCMGKQHLEVVPVKCIDETSMVGGLIAIRLHANS